MKFVIFNAVDPDWLKSSQADMEGNLSSLDAALPNAIQDFGSEVKAGGGSGGRSTLLGIDGLIALAVVRRIRTRDVGRERDVADAIQSSEKVGGSGDRLEADAALAEFGAAQDFGLKLILFAEEKALADADFAAGANQAFPIVRIGGELTGQQNFDASVKKIASRGIVRADGLSPGAFAAAIKPGRKNAGVVEDDEIAGLQQVGKIAELAIGISACGSLQVQQARSVTGVERFLGDEFAGEIEVEVGNSHDPRLQDGRW